MPPSQLAKSVLATPSAFRGFDERSPSNTAAIQGRTPITRQEKLRTADTLSDSCCFHCGESIPLGTDISISINGALRYMCCPGCEAVASLITGTGLQDFYARRSAPSTRPGANLDSVVSAYLAYDTPAIQNEFVKFNSSSSAELRLLVGGITCAACAWLIERTLSDVADIEYASLNLQQACLLVRFQPEKLKVSQIFGRVAALGYSVQPWKASASREMARKEYRQDLRRLGVAGIGMMQVGMFAIALHAGDIQGIDSSHQALLRVVSLIVCTLVVAFSARGFFESAWRHLRRGILVMDLPVAIAIACAFTASVFATLNSSGQVYYDSVVMFIFFLLGARFIEKRMRYRNALSWSDAEDVLPDLVQVRRDETWIRVARRELEHGDRILITKGETIPTDGVLTTGSSEVREDALNGEAIPRVVTQGDSVFAGTLNLSASIQIEAQGGYSDTRLAALQRSIELASADKPNVVQLADRVASYFVGAILLIASLTLLAWWQIDSERALWVALSVLVISCPCALSLATPACLSSAAALLRKNGVLVCSENALVALNTVTHAFFDKTGTLTTGRFQITHTRLLTEQIDEDTALSLCAALQQHSSHPIAAAFQVFSAMPRVDQVDYKVGLGMIGFWNGQKLCLGSPNLSPETASLEPPHPRESHWLLLSLDSKALAWVAIEDQPRIEAATLIECFKRAGIYTGMLSGDASENAAKLGIRLGIDENLIAQTPEQKLARIQRANKGESTTLMVGDGLNDAAVMRGASCSIAVAGASDLANAQADFIVLDSDLLAIRRIITTAERTHRVIRQNLAWALSYNALGIPFAAAGLVPPWLAAIGMSLSSLLVISNAGRLQRQTRYS